MRSMGSPILRTTPLLPNFLGGTYGYDLYLGPGLVPFLEPSTHLLLTLLPTGRVSPVSRDLLRRLLDALFGGEPFNSRLGTLLLLGKGGPTFFVLLPLLFLLSVGQVVRRLEVELFGHPGRAARLFVVSRPRLHVLRSFVVEVGDMPGGGACLRGGDMGLLFVRGS